MDMGASDAFFETLAWRRDKEIYNVTILLESVPPSVRAWGTPPRSTKHKAPQSTKVDLAVMHLGVCHDF